MSRSTVLSLVLHVAKLVFVVADVRSTVVPSGLSWRASAAGSTYWGYSTPLNNEDALNLCHSRNASLWRLLNSDDFYQAQLVLTSTFWVGLNSPLDPKNGVHWEDGSLYDLSTYPPSFDVTKLPQFKYNPPWCAAAVLPSDTTDTFNWWQPMDCSSINNFLCSFPSGTDTTVLQQFGMTYTIGNTTVLAVTTPLPWPAAKQYCKKRGGRLSSLANVSFSKLLNEKLSRSTPRDAILAALDPTVASTPPPIDLSSIPKVWLGLQNCSQEYVGQGYNCTWDGNIMRTYLEKGTLPSGQPTTVIAQQSLSNTGSGTMPCASMSLKDLGWDVLTSCQDTAYVVCQADTPKPAEGYTVVHNSANYIFISTPATHSQAASTCASLGASLPADASVNEQIWLASVASKLMRGQQVLIGSSASAADPSASRKSASRRAAKPQCTVLGARNPIVIDTFMHGTLLSTDCSEAYAFVCRRGKPTPSAPVEPVAFPSPAVGTTSTNASANPQPGAAVDAQKQAASSNQKPEKQKSGLPTGAIFGICVAAGISLAVIAGLAIRAALRRRRSPPSKPPADPFYSGKHPFHLPHAPSPANTNEPLLYSAIHSLQSISSTTPTYQLSEPATPHGSAYYAITPHPAARPPSTTPTSSSSHSNPEVLHIVLDMEPDVDIKIFRDCKLGHGGFGSVFLGEYQGVPVAIKTLDVLAMGVANSDSAPSYELAAIKRELSILSQVQHPNIVKLYGGCLTPPNVMIVMELMECSLADYVVHAGGRLPVRTSLQIIRAVAAGITHLHPSIIHRDLKPQNILLDSKGNVKITDFGVSRIKMTTHLNTEHHTAGTIPYMAPECYQSSNVTEKCDIYSLGIILWECISGRLPWEGWNGMAIMYHVGCLQVRLPLGTDVLDCPPQVAQLIARCWSHDPADRPSAAEVVEEVNRLEACLLDQEPPAAAQGAAPAAVQDGAAQAAAAQPAAAAKPGAASGGVPVAAQQVGLDTMQGAEAAATQAGAPAAGQ